MQEPAFVTVGSSNHVGLMSALFLFFFLAISNVENHNRNFVRNIVKYFIKNLIAHLSQPIKVRVGNFTNSANSLAPSIEH